MNTLKGRKSDLITDENYIRIDGYFGSWYVIDKMTVKDKTYYLLEHNTYGDETPNLCIDIHGKVYSDDTYDDLETVLTDLEIL